MMRDPNEVTRAEGKTGRALRELRAVRWRLRWLGVAVLTLALGELVLVLWILRVQL